MLLPYIAAGEVGCVKMPGGLRDTEVGDVSLTNELAAAGG